jgi:hypothetical protein
LLWRAGEVEPTDFGFRVHGPFDSNIPKKKVADFVTCYFARTSSTIAVSFDLD